MFIKILKYISLITILIFTFLFIFEIDGMKLRSIDDFFKIIVYVLAVSLTLTILIWSTIKSKGIALVVLIALSFVRFFDCPVIDDKEFHSCTSCSGNGYLTKSEVIKDDCDNCYGRGMINCEYDYEWFKEEKGFYIDMMGVLEKGPNGKMGRYLSEYCSGGRLKSATSSNYDICPRCNGTTRQDCGECTGYGYKTKTIVENYDDSICNGTGYDRSLSCIVCKEGKSNFWGIK